MLSVVIVPVGTFKNIHYLYLYYTYGPRLTNCTSKDIYTNTPAVCILQVLTLRQATLTALVPFFGLLLLKKRLDAGATQRKIGKVPGQWRMLNKAGLDTRTHRYLVGIVWVIVSMNRTTPLPVPPPLNPKPHTQL